MYFVSYTEHYNQDAYREGVDMFYDFDKAIAFIKNAYGCDAYTNIRLWEANELRYNVELNVIVEHV